MKITLKDGSVREYSEPMTVNDIAFDISGGLGRAACAGEIDGEVVDLRTTVDKDCNLNILTFKDEAGKVVDVLVGTCFICGAKGDEFISLTPDQMKQFKKEFQYPQKLVRRNNEIVAKDIKPHEMER